MKYCLALWWSSGLRPKVSISNLEAESILSGEIIASCSNNNKLVIKSRMPQTQVCWVNTYRTITTAMQNNPSVRISIKLVRLRNNSQLSSNRSFDCCIPFVTKQNRGYDEYPLFPGTIILNREFVSIPSELHIIWRVSKHILAATAIAEDNELQMEQVDGNDSSGK